MTDLASLRDQGFFRDNWPRLRPFYCRLTPELFWEQIRNQLVEELTEEVQAQIAEDFEYATYFTYPTAEQMRVLHEREQGGGLFFSEIREIVGFRCSEALGTLAGMIRLERDGDTRLLLEESFQNLWSKFAQALYGHGYDTPNTRATLVLSLAGNNAFELVEDRRWIEAIRDYFNSERHPWSQAPLRELYPGAIKILGGESEIEVSDDPVVRGELDLSGESFDDLCSNLHWEQGRPEDFRSAEPHSIFYRLPYHLVRVKGFDLEHLGQGDLKDGFARAAAHFLAALELRTVIVDEMDVDTPFSATLAADALGASEQDTRMILGQMIKIGLVEFDRALPWFDKSQQYVYREDARLIGTGDA